MPRVKRESLVTQQNTPISQDHSDSTMTDSIPEPQPEDAMNGSHGGDQSMNGADCGDQSMKDANIDGTSTRVDGNASHSKDDLAAMGEKSRLLIQTIQRLETLSIDATLPSLPKIVVCGDQSAGKSSLIEALCDISLPRSEGTCTRCPFQITTTQAEPGTQWKCIVSLLCKYSFAPKMTTGTYPRWAEMETVTKTEFKTLHSKDDLEVTLRRAQIAILNPRKKASDYVNVDLSLSQSYDIAFSPNVIGIEIAEEGLPELSLYDLPGAINAYRSDDIANAGDDKEVPGFIQKLIKHFVTEEKALILFAYPSTHDLITTTTIDFIRSVEAEHRTVLVMTKADFIAPTQFPNIAKNLVQNKFNFKHGLYITKQLSQEQINHGIPHSEAIQLENDFFSQNQWIQSPMVDFRHRFGIVNLRTMLSTQLTLQIKANVPEIVERVQKRSQVITESLMRFPAPVTSPVLTVLQEIDRVQKKVLQEIDADRSSGLSDFRREYQKLLRTLAADMKSNSPTVNFTTPGYTPPSIAVDSDSGSEMEETPSKSRKRNRGTPMKVTPILKGQTATPRTPQSRLTAPSKRSAPSMSEQFKKIFQLDDIKARLGSAPGSDIPDHSSAYVARALMRESVLGWSPLVKATLDKIESEFSAMVIKSIQEELSPRQSTPLYSEVLLITKAAFGELWAKTKADIHNQLEAELYRPLTYATEALAANRRIHEKQLVDTRQHIRLREADEQYDAEYEKPLSQAEKKKKYLEDAEQGRGPLSEDPYRLEIEIVGSAVSYYHLTRVSVVDQIAKKLEFLVMYQFEKLLPSKLREDLRVTDPEHCASLLVEDPARENERRKLLAEQKKLEQAIVELSKLGMEETAGI